MYSRLRVFFVEDARVVCVDYKKFSTTDYRVLVNLLVCLVSMVGANVHVGCVCTTPVEFLATKKFIYLSIGIERLMGWLPEVVSGCKLPTSLSY